MHEGFVLRGGRGCYLSAVGASIYPPRTLFVKRSQAGSHRCALCAFTRLLRIMYIMRVCEYFTMRLKRLNHAVLEHL